LPRPSALIFGRGRTLQIRRRLMWLTPRTDLPGLEKTRTRTRPSLRSRQGVVLGLISFTSSDAASQTIKVGAASLAGGVLIASSLYLLVARSAPPDHNRAFAASVMLIVLLWLLAFGLLCVVASMWSAR
jgi:hypothetical protein